MNTSTTSNILSRGARRRTFVLTVRLIMALALVAGMASVVGTLRPTPVAASEHDHDHPAAEPSSHAASDADHRDDADAPPHAEDDQAEVHGHDEPAPTAGPVAATDQPVPTATVAVTALTPERTPTPDSEQTVPPQRGHEDTEAAPLEHDEQTAPTRAPGAQEPHAENEAPHDDAQKPHGDNDETHAEANTEAHGEEGDAHGDDGGHGAEAPAVSTQTKTIVLGSFAGVNGLVVVVAAVLRRRNPPKLPKHLQR